MPYLYIIYLNDAKKRKTHHIYHLYIAMSVSYTHLDVYKRQIIDLYADWCGPCRMVAPIMKELANHIKRPEVQKALKDGKGYDLRRIYETTGKTYFSSATAYEVCIIRSAPVSYTHLNTIF